MSEERVKVLEMVASGVITPHEGVRLLEALGAAESGGRAGGKASGSRVNFDFDLPQVKLPRVDLGNLGEMVMELKNTVTQGAQTGYSRFKSSKAGKYVEVSEFSLDGPSADGVNTAELKIACRAGSMRVKDAPEGGSLLSISAKKVAAEPTLSVQADGGHAKGELACSLGRAKVGLARGVRYMLDVENTAAEANYDLRELIVERLNADNNAGSLSLALGELCESVHIVLKNNAGDVQLKLPAGHALKLRFAETLSSSNFAQFGLTIAENEARSDDWDFNEKKIELELSQNLASFSLLWRK